MIGYSPTYEKPLKIFGGFSYFYGSVVKLKNKFLTLSLK